MGDPVSCAIGLTVLDQLKDGHLVANVTKVGRYLKLRLVEVCSLHAPNLVGEVRGEGFSLGIDFVKTPIVPVEQRRKHTEKIHRSRDPNPDAAHIMRQKLFERHVMVSVCGTHRNVIGFTPPYTLTEGEFKMSVSLQ